MNTTEEEGPKLLIPNHKTWREDGGRLIHDGDCHFWAEKLCTCGLIHHLLFFVGDGMPEWFYEERDLHERALDRLGKLESLQPLAAEKDL